MNINIPKQCERIIKVAYKKFNKKMKNLFEVTYLLIQNVEGIEELKNHGYELKHLQDKLWEIKKESIRICYYLKKGNYIYLLYLFEKKTNKTPKKVIDYCLAKIKEIM